jgi:hypothetical protein
MENEWKFAAMVLDRVSIRTHGIRFGCNCNEMHDEATVAIVNRVGKIFEKFWRKNNASAPVSKC